MASPISKTLMHRAIGESGAFFGRTLHAQPVSVTEQDGNKFADELGATSLIASASVRI
jgi:para-nitrobenzyl esterase